MKTLHVLCLFTLVCFSGSYGRDLIVGTSYNTRLIWTQKVEYMGIPLKKRTKEVFYSDPAQTTIKGIILRENDSTQAEPIVTAGGVGFSYVNIRLKSERGSGLNYQVEIYA